MNLKESILATLAYHDIFDYPLTEFEIYSYLIGKKSTPANVKNQTKRLVQKKKLGQQRGFYFISKRKNLPMVRSKRQKISQCKLNKAKFFAGILKLIPSIELVAISGALSMSNSTKNDDIDLLVVTSKNTLWATRFMANLILLPYKRSPNSRTQKNKACLNIFLEEKALKIADENLYTAHEICQMKPIWDRSNTYQKFIRSNIWIKQYLPNWEPSYQSEVIRSGKYISGAITTGLSTIEKMAKLFQLRYMRSKITNERIGKRQLFFHPGKTQEKVLKKYRHLTNKLLGTKITPYDFREAKL